MSVEGAATTSYHERVAEEVRALLARKRISASRVAAALGWTDNYISRRLTAKTPFDVNDLDAIAGVLGVPITAFFEFRGEAYFLRNTTISAGTAPAKPVFTRPVVDRRGPGLAA